MAKMWDGNHPTGGKGVPVLDAKAGQCKWPLGKWAQKTTRYCGEPVKKEGAVYCAHHHAISYARYVKPVKP